MWSLLAAVTLLVSQLPCSSRNSYQKGRHCYVRHRHWTTCVTALAKRWCSCS
ncbi:hypothetical protein M758_UG211000 [Ceratodon purpureus]|nr:hypothetical protein M758_UG211000 [Ceratodon purpureus]